MELVKEFQNLVLYWPCAELIRSTVLLSLCTIVSSKLWIHYNSGVHCQSQIGDNVLLSSWYILLAYCVYFNVTYFHWKIFSNSNSQALIVKYLLNCRNKLLQNILKNELATYGKRMSDKNRIQYKEHIFFLKWEYDNSLFIYWVTMFSFFFHSRRKHMTYSIIETVTLWRVSGSDQWEAVFILIPACNNYMYIMTIMIS
jgi:hypothetical protein